MVPAGPHGHQRHQPAIHWFDQIAPLRHALVALEPFRQAGEGAFEPLDTLRGWCAGCSAWREFRLPRPVAGGWRDLRESFICVCGLNGRMRAALLLLEQAAAGLGTRPRMLALERLTSLYTVAHARLPSLEGAEYLGPTCRPGQQVPTGGILVRHESLERLSPGDGSLDLVFHADVLEHVADFKLALTECARVLRKGGSLLFTCPMFDLESHIKRASVGAAGMVHHLPPVYHGNPLSEGGSLVFHHFGWPLFDDVLRAGFSAARIALVYDPLQGIVSNNNPYAEGRMWQLFIAATR